jgi:hypothetical protein
MFNIVVVQDDCVVNRFLPAQKNTQIATSHIPANFVETYTTKRLNTQLEKLYLITYFMRKSRSGRAEEALMPLDVQNAIFVTTQRYAKIANCLCATKC